MAYNNNDKSHGIGMERIIFSKRLPISICPLCNIKLIVLPKQCLRKICCSKQKFQKSCGLKCLKKTEIDVRIIDDEVTIKLVQRKKINCCLVYASRVLNEFKLDLQHVASGHIGDFCIFFINRKICEGSLTNASALANKLIEVMETSLAAT